MTKNLLITGDSFCAVRNQWPSQFCNLLGDHTLYGTGFSGCSWWSTRKEIIKYIKTKDNIHTLIVLHTEPFRIPSDKDLPLNFAHVDQTSPSNIGEPYYTALKTYYKYLQSGPFCLWAYFNWFQELDVIISKSSVEKVAHIYCFPGFWTKHIFKTGITIQNDMQSWSNRPQKDFICDNSKTFPNHLSLEGNELFAKRLHEIFTTRYQDSVGITDF